MGEELNDDIISDSQESSSGTIIYEYVNPELSVNEGSSFTSVSPNKGSVLHNSPNGSEIVNQATTSDSQEDPIIYHSTTREEPSTSLNNEQLGLERDNYAPRRMLRKRTAIQKMPYSLERIRHRQLLEGYDVSLFDVISNQIDLSALEDKINKANLANIPTTGKNNENNSINNHVKEMTMTQDSKSYKYNSDIDSEYSDNSLQEDNYDVNIEDQYDSDEEIHTVQKHFENTIENNSNDSISPSEDSEPDILFRGKRLKVKTGYRGVLPKMVWEKQLSSVEKRPKNTKRLLPIKDGKGVAKKKRVISNTDQDASLLKELIVDDSEEEDGYDDITKNFELYHQTSNNNKDENPYLMELDKYYHDKYDNNYLSDSSLKYELDETNIENLQRENYVQSDTKNNIYTINESDDFVLADGELYPSFDDDLIVIEDNYSELDPLLNGVGKVIEYPTKEKISHRSFLTKRKYVKRGRKKTRNKKPGVIKRVSIKNYKRLSPILSNNNKHEQNVEEIEPEIDIEESDKKEEKKPRKRRYFTKRNITTYNTVVEAATGQFKFKSHKNREYNIKENFFDKVITTSEASPLEVLDVFFKKTTLTPPDTVVVSVNNKSYTLSRFNSDDVERIMQTIFDCIINEGSSEESLLDLCKQITNFLWQLNIPSIRVTIEEFYTKFKDKLNGLKQNAKPIHFYILAVCQLMLLEVTKYGNIALIYKEKIEKTILNHIALLFSILSVCYEKMIKGNTDLLNQSYDILATIIDELGKKKELWKIFSEKRFIPDVVEVLCNIFPTKTPQWAVINIENDFIGLKKTLSLVSYCYHSMHWDIEPAIILKLHDIFKLRRFTDFKEEESLSENNKVCTNPETAYACKSIFNQYLCLLRQINISNILLEKLTPISRMIPNDSPSALINRLNLLVLLAHISDLNYANRFQLLITQLVEIKFMGELNLQDRKRVCESLLNAVIFFLLNSAKKNTTMKYSVIPMIYEDVMSSAPFKKHLWVVFLSKIRHVVNKHRWLWYRLSKALFKCGIATDVDKDNREVLSLFLDIYMDNLQNTDSKWVFANLFPLMRDRAQSLEGLVYAYCKIGESLIKKGELNWWQFLTFNSLESSPEIRFHFTYEVLKLCDDISFKNIEKDFYSIVVNNIDTSIKNKYFWKLCGKLLQKSGNDLVNIDLIGNDIVNYLPLWRRLLRAMGKLKYNDLVILLTRKVADMYGNGILDDNCTRGIVTFLDSKFIDYLQDITQFNHLRKVFQISNQEMENNKFRKTIGALSDITEQVLYIEQSILNANFDDIIEKKIVSLFLTTNEIPNLNPYRLIVTTIAGNQCNSLTPIHLFKKKMRISNFLLSIILSVNFKKFYHLKESEYLDLFQLAHFIFVTYGFKNVGAKKSRIYATFMETSARFIIHMADISMGFDESSLLSQFSTYAPLTTDVNVNIGNVDIKTLGDKIDALLLNSTRTDDSDLDDVLPESDMIENRKTLLDNILLFSN